MSLGFIRPYAAIEYKLLVSVAILAMGTLYSGVSASRSNESLAEIKQAIIRDSIASYSGNCACPFNSAKNGSSCGRRSAYSRAGGYSVICYPNDVTDEMVRNYKKRKTS